LIIFLEIRAIICLQGRITLLDSFVRFRGFILASERIFCIRQLISTALAAIAEFETARRRERQRQGIEAAKKKNKYKGRKTVITKDLIKKVEKYKNLGVSVTEIGRITGKSRSTIYKVLKNELGYVSNRLVKSSQVGEAVNEGK